MWKMSALIDERLGEWPQAAADWKRAFELYPTKGLNDQWGNAMAMANRVAPPHGSEVASGVLRVAC